MEWDGECSYVQVATNEMETSRQREKFEIKLLQKACLQTTKVRAVEAAAMSVFSAFPYSVHPSLLPLKMSVLFRKKSFLEYFDFHFHIYLVPFLTNCLTMLTEEKMIRNK